MNARSALFDLYGDHLRAHGGRAPVAALVRLLAPLGVADPAVRTAVSRMVRQGWLERVRLADGAGYALTPRAARRLDEAAHRLYHGRDTGWDGTWHLVVTGPVKERSRRDRLRAGMSLLGYAMLDDRTWLGPRPSQELDVLLETEGIGAERFRSRHDGDTLALVGRAWDLEALGHAYTRWLEEARAVAAGAAGDGAGDEEAFAARSRLVHDWRQFLFRDPGLPRELLPADWPGVAAAEFFVGESRRLLPAANRFVHTCLTGS